MPKKAQLRVASWNVNGLRACAGKGFLDWLAGAGASIVGVQEVRSTEAALPREVANPKRWHAAFSAAERKGYSGVGLFSREAPSQLECSLGVPHFDSEGRVQLARFGKLTVANVYFPNGSGKDRSNDRVPYKLDFYRRVFDVLEPVRKRGEPVLVMGDFNTAHREIDLARPKDNVKTSGFLPEEREELDRWLRAGWVDTFRSHEPAGGHYTWWSQRFGVRERNVGWRIDYILASKDAYRYVKAARIHPDVRGSDHCPVSVDLDPGVLG